MRFVPLLFTLVLFTPHLTLAAEPNLITNADFEARDANNRPTGFTLTGAATYGYLGDRRREMTSNGVILPSIESAGGVSCVVSNIDSTQGNWFRFTFRGLPEDGFAVRSDDLFMRVDFAADGGKTSHDDKVRKIYHLVESARKDLAVNGVRGRGGAAVWTTYTLDFRLPFPQTDTLKLSVGFAKGEGRGERDSEFLVDDFSLVRIPAPAGEHVVERPTAVVPQGKLLPLGGRWFYATAEGETAAPTRFDSTNADRLLYKDAGYFAPFAGNTSAVLRVGQMDLSGNVMRSPKRIADNVVITFDRGAMVIKSHGVPNHPTGQFPEQGFGNPSYIGEQDSTFYLPLEPKRVDKPRAVDKANTNGALHMGPIGVAVNGVVFFNPFDMGNTDAANFMDRCCGHPNRDNQYHYHKYPICVNTPWADEGAGHSPLLGWAFDGFPVYGPFESADVMAKDVRGKQALDGCNAHYDADRGWHYHVTPGRFPYIIGGFFGEEDSRNSPRRGGPPGNGGRGGGRGGGEGMGPSPDMGSEVGDDLRPPPPQGGRPRRR